MNNDESKLHVGVASTDITPPVGATLVGYKPRASTELGHTLRAEAMVARVAEAKTVGIKVKIEYGMGPTAVWPIHSPEIRKAIVAAARSHELPVYVHAFSEDEQRIAIEMQAHALVHGGFMRGAPSDEVSPIRPSVSMAMLRSSSH